MATEKKVKTNPFQYLYYHIKNPWNIEKLGKIGDQRLFDALDKLASLLNQVNEKVVVTTPSTGGGGDHWIINEVPTGAQDGINTTFGLSHLPDDPTSVLPFVNGVLQHYSVDFTMSGSNIHMTKAPDPNDYPMRVTYRIVSGDGGSGGGGAISSLSVSAPLTTTGGSNPVLGLTTPLAVTYGGSATATPGLIAGTGVTITGTWPNQTINATAGSGGIVKIAETILGSNAATVTFSSIAATYRNLIIRYTARSTSASSATDCYVQFNTDTGANYSRVYANMSNAAFSPGNTIGNAKAAVFTATGSGAAANLAVSGEILIYDYARTTFLKNYQARMINYSTAISGISSLLISANWNSTAAINSILLGINDGSNFTTGSVFTLFGEG